MKKRKMQLHLVVFALIVGAGIFSLVKYHNSGDKNTTLLSTLSVEDLKDSSVILDSATYRFHDYVTSAKGVAGDRGLGCRISLRRDSVAFGDFTNDRNGDAAAIVGVDCLGGLHQAYLALWTNTDTKAVPLGAVRLGDRIPIFSISIDSPHIKLDRGGEFGGPQDIALRKVTAYLVEKGKIKEDATESTSPVVLPRAGWGTYTSEKYGFQFSYPDDWGTVREFTEKGLCPARQITVTEPCIHISLAFSSVKGSGIFLSTASPLFVKYPNRRAGYWGDIVGKILSSEFVTSFCTDRASISCSLVNNSFSSQYVRYHAKDCINDSDKTCDKEAIYYYLKSQNPTYFSVVISNAYLLGTENVELYFDEMMATFRFL